jgi:hypothetical protein
LLTANGTLHRAVNFAAKEAGNPETIHRKDQTNETAKASRNPPRQ